MTLARGALGLWGEEAAARHLQAKGFRVLQRRWRTKCGELDLVAEDRGTLVFVEVKACRVVRAGSHSAENVHGLKG
ncbi:MAG: YraN family protein, partial [bacterium]